MNLIVVCIVAFLTVMTLLSVLALVIRLLTRLFPEKPSAGTAAAGSVDAATLAAIQSSVHANIPGAQLLRVEPEK